jgi:hypothetical protein
MVYRFKCILIAMLAVLSTSAAVSTRVQAQGDVRVAARSGVAIRSNPTTDATIIETLQSMAKVTVLENLGGWLRVASASKVGYVRASDLSAPAVTPVVGVFESPTPVYQTQAGQMLVGYKDPGTATLFSVLLTGGGHFYSGDSKKGAVLLGIGLGSLIAGAAATSASCDAYSCSTSTAPIVVGSLVYLGTWIYGIADAGSAARRHNAAVGLRTVGSRLTLRQLAAGTTGIGLSFDTGR